MYLENRNCSIVKVVAVCMLLIKVSNVYQTTLLATGLDMNRAMRTTSYTLAHICNIADK